MKMSRLIIAAVVLAGLGGAVWWSNKQEALKEKQPDPNARHTILGVAEADMKHFELRPRSGEPIVVDRDADGVWEITKPQKMRADLGAITSMLASVSNLLAERILDENPTDIATYGLNPPVFVAEFTTNDGKVHTLNLGDTTPGGASSQYVMTSSDKRLYVASTFVKDALGKSVSDLRDKTVIAFDPDKISRVEFTIPGKPAIEFGRSGDLAWQILKPRPLRADGAQVEDILTRLRQVALNPEIDEKVATSAFATAQPLASIKITDPSGVKSIEIRKLKDEIYARSSVGTFRVNNEAGDGWAKSLDDFRAKKLFDFGFSEPNKIDVTMVQSTGTKTRSLAKNGADWSDSGKTMDSLSVQGLIDKLRDLSTSKLVESGFSKSVLDIAVESNSGKLREKVQISEAGDHFVARRENDPTLYQLEKDVVNDLRSAIDSVGPPAPAAKGGEKKK